MTQHKCDKCGKEFSQKTDLVRHNKRKFPCVTEIKCQMCGMVFKHRTSMYRHQKKCNVKSISQTNNSISINNNIVNNVDGDVKVVKFGNENLSYISDDLYKQILGRGFMAVCEFVGHSHFNKEHPENHNIYMANMRDDFVVLYDGDKWTLNRKDETMEDIIYAKSDFLFNKFRELEYRMRPDEIERFMRFMNSRDAPDTMERLKDDLQLQLYNNRSLPQKIRRQLEAIERHQEYQKIKYITKNKDKLNEVLKLIDDNVSNKEVLEKLCTLLNSK
jgi:uncharacterized C2H2 Zn-finger protein